MSFSTFKVDSLTAPVTNAGQPMVSSPFSFFLAAVPGTGYRLYILTNVVDTLFQATIRSPFNAPTRKANQPGTTSTVDSSDGNILASPYYDGTSIWFTHVIDVLGFPTVRYGAINLTNNGKVVDAAVAFHSATSDDFNPSLAVGLNPSGTSVYLNWAFTDAPAGTATSAVVDTLPAGQPIANLIGTGAVYAVGSTTTQTRFGDFSSVAIASCSGCSGARRAERRSGRGGSGAGRSRPDCRAGHRRARPSMQPHRNRALPTPESRHNGSRGVSGQPLHRPATAATFRMSLNRGSVHT